MNKLMLLGLTVVALMSGGTALADSQEQAKKQAREQQTTGSEMMTREERQEHRSKMHSATTKEEREKVRAEQHEKMKKRAKEQGKTMPENPPAGGMGGRMGGGY